MGIICVTGLSKIKDNTPHGRSLIYEDMHLLFRDRCRAKCEIGGCDRRTECLAPCVVVLTSGGTDAVFRNRKCAHIYCVYSK